MPEQTLRSLANSLAANRLREAAEFIELAYRLLDEGYRTLGSMNGASTYCDTLSRDLAVLAARARARAASVERVSRPVEVHQEVNQEHLEAVLVAREDYDDRG